MLEALRSRIARLISPASKGAPARAQQRMYASARQTRLTGGWHQIRNSSADGELVTSLTTLRSRSRALVRDAGYAKRAKTVIQNNVIGSGIGMQAQVMTTRGTLAQSVNDEIESVWEEWTCGEYCHTGGALNFADMERALIGQIFEAGEVFIRKHYMAFGDSAVPFALEMIEAERLADEFMAPQPGPLANGAAVRMGVELDSFYRPVAYWIRPVHPGDLLRSGLAGEFAAKYERVPAEQIIHLRIIDRWPQTRGEPWMHAVISKLTDMDGYTEAEIIAARGAANYMGIIESPEPDGPIGETQPDGSVQATIEPGIVQKLGPGETFNFVNPGRPNANADPFMRLMLREVAAGIGTSYESLSRDYSQSNYSSSRLALLDDRDLWRMLQGWFIRTFREEVHEEWLQQAVLSRAITSIGIGEYGAAPEKFECALFKPRGWSWIDPTKEVEAYKEAIMCGLTTTSAVIAATGGGQDLEDVLNERERELKAMKEKGLVFATDPSLLTPANIRGAPQPPDNAAMPAANAKENDPHPRVVSIQR